MNFSIDKTFLFSLLFAIFLATPLISYAKDAPSFVDSDGTAIFCTHPYKRIISLYPAHTTNLIALGLQKKIIAVGKNDEQIPGLPEIRFQDDPERLLALNPDLVLIRPMISRSYPQLVAILKNNGVQVVSLQPAALPELYSYWQNLGKLGGTELAASKMVSTFKEKLSHLREELAAIPMDKRKKVYFESMHRQMKTFAPDSMAISVLEAAGGVDVAADAPQVRNTNIAAYGKERILAKAKDIDVYLAQRGPMNPVTVHDILTEPGFATIKAIQEKQVFLVDEAMVSRPTMELLQGISFVRSLLYPDFTKGRDDS